MGDWLMQSIFEPSSRQLCLEMQRATLGFKLSAFEALLDMGVSQDHLAELTGRGDIGRMRVEFGRDGDWNPIDVGGGPALILPVMDGDVLIDMIAISPKTPDSWALRNGNGRILGADNVPGSGDWESGVRNVRVFSNPMEWLIAGSVGICILAWDQRAIAALRNFGPDVHLQADSAALAEFIETQMQSIRMLPVVDVLQETIMLEAAE